MHTFRAALFTAGYITAIAVIVRFTRVVRGRRLGWLIVHHIGVACIVAGWAISASWPAVAINLAWLAASTAWYVLGGRRPALPQS